MMLSTVRAYAGFAAIILFASCSDMADNPSTSTDTPAAPGTTSGQFGMSLMKGLNRASAQAAGLANADPVVQFDLGVIRSSNAYYFLLYNVGQQPITDVVIMSDNDHFIVSPQNIDSLMPNGHVEMMPIIKVSVVHGTPIEGIGSRTCLPAGDDTAALTITGRTKTGADIDTSLVLSANLKIEAMVVSFELQLACSTVALESPKLWSSNVKLLDGSMGGSAPAYGIDAWGTKTTPGKWAKIINKSNLPLVVSAYYYNANVPGLKTGPISDSVGIGDSVFINREVQNHIIVCVDGDHTVNDFNVLQPQSDGRTYFSVWQVGTADTTDGCAPDSASNIINFNAQ